MSFKRSIYTKILLICKNQPIMQLPSNNKRIFFKPAEKQNSDDREEESKLPIFYVYVKKIFTLRRNKPTAKKPYRS